MELEICSESYIKPSSPTPPCNKTYKISLMDQFLVNYGIDIPLILFYPNLHQHRLAINDFISKRSQTLKQSLSEALAYYYPFAGRIKDSLSVDCNDEGVYYVEARANTSLFEYCSHTDNLTCGQLLPRQPGSYEPSSAGAYVVMIKETTFTCGGVTIGIFGSHMVMDAAPMASFVKCWAAIACNSSKDITYPNFNGPSMFPQYNAFPREATMAALDEAFIKTGKLAATRFVFDESRISDLRHQLSDSGTENLNPNGAELVSAFLYGCISETIRARSGVVKPNAFINIVDFRGKAEPPLPENSLGNFFWMAPGLISHNETKLASLICKMKEATSKIDTDFVKNIQSGHGFSKLYEMMKETKRLLTSNSTCSDGADIVMISSMCNLGLYEVDFGWGEPIWVTCVDSPPDSITQFVNSFNIMDSREGKGIEAWVFLDEQDLVLLEQYEKLLEYASVYPSPV
ncbi:stemmadenine O-acetyltransferase-like [Mercurialis annua]|uniref:stemmadenine O-acetyltransferase-like n=1 Tax=Mercurialis annua TaxID=3986 RepID=UPI00215FF10F|nr:stemmadenine O-acetyltransferase-like [Mercurialis annua]